jgi:hypothetical protein
MFRTVLRNAEDIEKRKMYVCMYKGRARNPALAPRPSMIYCAPLLINPLLILHFE